MGMIEINNLTRDYGNNKGVFNVSFQVDEGEVFGQSDGLGRPPPSVLWISKSKVK